LRADTCVTFAEKPPLSHPNNVSYQRPIVVSMGDPCGIGPEVTSKAWQALHSSGPVFAVLGDIELYSDVPRKEIAGVSEAARVFKDALPVLQGFSAEGALAGQPNPKFAATVLNAIEQGVALVQMGDASALVTAPIAKSVVMAAGFSHPGHTEYLGALLANTPFAGTRGPIMMLAVEGLRVVPVTVHCALREVPQRLTTSGIVNAARTTDEALRRDFQIGKPRLAIAALNPHAGEGGAFGDEEARIMGPAIAELRALGIDANGPYPADSLFHAQARAAYDAIICMYHDQALIPLKTIDFWGGVNITLGLPIIRTSPDHGTGFDIAGRGIANPESMIAAIKLAKVLGRQRALA
jgi:4-hydroxythreonine-4-phosphate dehydrogenase